MKKIIFIILCTLQLAAFSQTITNDVLTDSRDGKKYKVQKFGNQLWMVENLNFKTPNSWVYDNKEENAAKYGRLYNYQDAMKACPAGWVLPTDIDWEFLAADFADESDGIWFTFKSNDEAWLLTFSGRHNEKNIFEGIGVSGAYWSSEDPGKDPSGKSFQFDKSNNSIDAYVEYEYLSVGVGVRCLKEIK